MTVLTPQTYSSLTLQYAGSQRIAGFTIAYGRHRTVRAAKLGTGWGARRESQNRYQEHRLGRGCGPSIRRLNSGDFNGADPDGMTARGYSSQGRAFADYRREQAVRPREFPRV